LLAFQEGSQIGRKDITMLLLLLLVVVVVP
jgi:hypothetical protein